MSKLTKNVISFAFIALIAVSALGVSAQVTVPTDDMGLSTASLETTAQKLIKTVLTFLGLVAIVMVLIGGFKWMTSGGNEEKVGEAKKLLGAGIVGLVIIMLAYALTAFVINNMNKAANVDTSS